MPSFGWIALAVGIALWLILVDRVEWHPYATWLVVWSVTAFVFYALDKSRARGGAWRVPEIVLHGLALLGGFVGCLAGMLFFRHKTLHTAFKIVLVVAAIIHGALILSLLR